MDAEAVRSVNVHYDEELPVAPLMLLDVAGQTAGEVESLLKQTEDLVGATRADFETGKAGEGGKFGVVAWKMTWDDKEAENLWSTRKRAFFAAPSLRKEEIEKGAKMAVLVTDVAGRFERAIRLLKVGDQLTSTHSPHIPSRRSPPPNRTYRPRTQPHNLDGGTRRRRKLPFPRRRPRRRH